VSLSLISSKYEKVEQHTRKKTDRPITLRFLVKDSVNPLCEFDLVLISPWLFHKLHIYTFHIFNTLKNLEGKEKKIP